MEHVIDVDGLEVFYVDEGEGPAVLLLHGFPDSSDLWRHQIPKLVANGYRVLAPDLRGFGRSSKPQDVASYRIQSVLNDVWGVLRHASVTRAHVVGHDWGAQVAWVLAAASPRWVDHLVVLSAGHPAELLSPSVEQRQRSWYMLFYQFAEAEQLLTRDGWRLFREMAAASGVADEQLERYVTALSAPGALTSALNWYRANFGPQLEAGGVPRLPAITAPTLGVWSTGDRVLTEPPMQDSKRHVAAPWRYERVAGAGHWIPFDAPDEVTDLVLSFLGSHPTPAGGRRGRRR